MFLGEKRDAGFGWGGSANKNGNFQHCMLMERVITEYRLPGELKIKPWLIMICVDSEMANGRAETG